MMRRHLAALCFPVALGASLVPGLVDAAEPFDAHVATASTNGDIGRRTATVVTDHGFAITAAHDRTDNTVDLVACVDPDCTNGERVTVASSYSGDFDIALGSDDRPVLAISHGTGVLVIKCGDLLCTSGNSTSSIAGVPGDYLSGYSSVSIDVRANNTPVVSYTFASWQHAEVRTVACNDIACSGNGEVTKTWGAANSSISSDIVVDGKGRAAMVWSSEDGKATLVRCSNSTCTSGSQQVIDNYLRGPSIAARGAALSVVGRSPWSTVRKVDCGSSCGSASTVSITSHDASFADVAFVGDRHSMVTYVSDRHVLYFIDCPSSCATPTAIARDAVRSSASIAGGNDQAFVSYQQGKNADLGLVWIHRASQWGW